MAIAFHDHKNFCGERARACAVTRIGDNIKLFPQTLTPEQHIRKYEILSWFNAVTYERFGILHGEYILFQHGMALLDKNGVLIMAGTASDDVFVRCFDDRMAVFNTKIKTALIQHWDYIPMLHNAAIVSDRFAGNYWHLSIEVIPRFRFYESYDVEHIIIPANHIQKKFQNDLLSRAIGDQKIYITSEDVIRVRDPVLAFSHTSTEGILWLRRKMNLTINKGSKRYYIRRGHRMSRTDAGGGHGGLVEDIHLIKLLEYFGFQTVDFGGGEHSIEEQVQMLDGAQMVLASHGAHLTNIVYLDPPLTVIEIFGPEMHNASYIAIANALSFDYYGITSDLLDSVGNIVVDCEKLYEIIEASSHQR